MKTSSVIATLMISFGSSLIGPAMFIAARSIDGGLTSHALYSDVVFFLWPSQAFGVMEHGYGRLVSWLVTVGVNVFLFILLGVVALFASRSVYHSVLFVIFIFVVFLLFAMWISGFDVHYINIFALVIAAAFYVAFLFLLMMLGCHDRSS